MKIIMKKSTPGSVDGIHVMDFAGGAEYDLTETDGERALAHSFVSSGVAVELAAGEAAASPVAPVAIAAEDAPARTPKKRK